MKRSHLGSEMSGSVVQETQSEIVVKPKLRQGMPLGADIEKGQKPVVQVFRQQRLEARNGTLHISAQLVRAYRTRLSANTLTCKRSSKSRAALLLISEAFMGNLRMVSLPKAGVRL